MRLIGMLVLGGLVGWFARDLTFDKTRQRSERTASRRAAEAPERERARAPRADAEDAGTAVRPEKDEPDPDPTPGPTEPAQADPLKQMVKTMTKQWKAMSSMFASQRGWKDKLMALGFDAATAEKIEKLMTDEAARQTEKAMEMMLDAGVELDPDSFYWFMGVGPKLSNETEKELSLFLSDDEMASVRKEIAASHEKQLVGYADVTMGMMNIPNLRDDQKTQIRDVLAGKDFIREQFVGFAQLTRNREALLHVLENPDALAKEMAERSKPMRTRLEGILDTEQLTQYTRFEQQMTQVAQMQIKMMGAMLGKTETKKPSGQ